MKKKLKIVQINCSRILKVVLFRLETDLCFLRASALTFYSILSVVPFLAVVFGIAKGFGIEHIVESTLRREFREQQEVMQYLIQFGYSLLEHTQGGVIAGIGVLTLLYTILNLFSTIEASLNYMWGLHTGRSLTRKIADYFALILICPIFFATASSVTLFISSQVENVDSYAAWLGQFRPLLQKTLLLLPYFVSSMLFTFLYTFIPNTRVHIRAALPAGIAAGIAYQILQATYISVQIVVTKTNAVYGSFAALPLFIFWLYLSWLIFLIGAEMVVILQERLWDRKILAPYHVLTHFEKAVVYIAITKMAVDAFIAGNPRISLDHITTHLQLPSRLVTELTEDLCQSGIIAKIQNNSDIVLAKNPEDLKISDVIGLTHGEQPYTEWTQCPVLDKFSKLLHSLEKRYAHENPLIKSISV